MSLPGVSNHAWRRGSVRREERLRRGFSLVELLVTLVLILILFVMFNGFASRSHQMSAKKACQINLQKIYLALDLYAKDHHGVLPATTGAKTSELPLALLVPHYTVASEAFICPGSKDSRLPDAKSFADRKISYAYWMGRHEGATNALVMSDRQINTQPKQKGQQVYSRDGKPPGNNHYKYGGNYLFTDGHLESSGPQAPFPIEWPSSVTLLNPRE